MCTILLMMGVMLCLLSARVTLAVIIPGTEDSKSFYRNLQSKKAVVYALVFDAGSTGTRLHIFRCRMVENHSTGFELEDEIKLKVKGGLSNYVNRPERAGANIKKLLEQAKLVVPNYMWEFTGAVVRATAGLRRVQETSYSAFIRIRRTVINELKASVFKLVPDEPFDILTGTQEAQFGWMTVNALLNRLNQKSSIGLLDMGGGSCQIAFSPQKVDKNDQFILLVETMAGKRYKLHAHSYHKLGILAARLRILGWNESDSNRIINLTTPCVHSNLRSTIKFNDAEANVLGERNLHNRSSVFEDCYDRAKKFITQNNVHRPQDIKNNDFLATSSFFYIANGTNILSRKTKTVAVGKFKEAAEKACLNPSLKIPYAAYYCIDTAYIYALLHDGFGFDNARELTITSKIRNFEASWAYGFAIHYLSTGVTMLQQQMCCTAQNVLLTHWSIVSSTLSTLLIIYKSV